MEYVIKTDLGPDDLDALGLEIYRMWVDWALGNLVLGGKRLMFPSGRLASAIRHSKEGPNSVVIYVADIPGTRNGEASTGKVADILESGHKAVDLKLKLAPGRYPMHRVQGQVKVPGTKMKLKRSGSNLQGTRPEVWAENRSATASGFASIGPNSAPDSWIIPAMPAYSPAKYLSQIANKMARFSALAYA